MIPLFGVVAAFGTVSDVAEPVSTHAVTDALAPAAVLAEEAAGAYIREERFQRGDTLAVLLERLGFDEEEAAKLLRSPQARLLRLLLPGTPVQSSTDRDDGVRSLSFLAAGDTLVSLERAGDGYRASETPADLTRRVEMKSGEIRSSLFAATDAAGLRDGVAMQLADIFAGDIDFHRDLRRGDRFSVVYEMFLHEGRAVRPGRVLAAEFTNQKKTYRAVWFQGADGKGGYYTPEGRNLRKAFLRSPLEFSRISSGFGMRRHPILKQWRAHKGIDYAAPVGTRVKATGDGMVEFAGRQGGYGTLVVIRHAGSYSTYYAHLSGLARGLRRGARVAQGELIGYVGASGWATGPHLHYEFHAGSGNRNPLTIAFPAAQPVPAGQLAAFRQSAEPLAARLDLLKNTDLALLE